MQAFLPALVAFSLLISSSLAFAADNVSSPGVSSPADLKGITDSETEAKKVVVDEATSKLSKDEQTQLELLENHFFGRVHPLEVLNRRIERLERFVFGTEASGVEYGARLDKLSATLSTVDPDGKKRVISIAPPAAAPEAGLPTVVNDNRDQPMAPAASTRADSNGPSSSSFPASEVGPREAGVLHCNKSLFPIDGEPVQVMHELSLAIKVHPLDPELMFERAKAEMLLDKIDNALSDLSDAIMNNPNRSLYYLARAWCYKRSGNSVLANDDLKQAKFVDPGLPAKIDFLPPTANSEASKTQ